MKNVQEHTPQRPRYAQIITAGSVQLEYSRGARVQRVTAEGKVRDNLDLFECGGFGRGKAVTSPKSITAL